MAGASALAAYLTHIAQQKEETKLNNENENSKVAIELQEKVDRYEKALNEIAKSSKLRGIGAFENKYNGLIETALVALRLSKNIGCCPECAEDVYENQPYVKKGTSMYVATYHSDCYAKKHFS